MKRLNNINRIMSLFLFFIIIYTVFTLVDTQSKINQYNKLIISRNSEKEELNSKKEELLATQENVNSEEYIEEIARRKLDMYLPNETVYVEVSK